MNKERKQFMKTCKPVLRALAVVLAFACIAIAADAPKLTFKFTTTNVPGALQTFPAGVNNKGVTVGQYEDKRGNFHGYVLKGKKLTKLDDPNGTHTGANGINYNKKYGEMVVGYYRNTSGNDVGFLYRNGTYTDVPGPAGATASGPQDINDMGWIVGWYFDSSNIQHGFLLQGNTYTTLDPPTSTIEHCII